MSNQGKRMVKENLIAQIGQGGGGTEYTAGTGIDITEDVISVENYSSLVQSTDLATVATSGDYTDLLNTPTIPVVSANTGATPTATLTDLDVDGTVYSVTGGGSSDCPIVTWLDPIKVKTYCPDPSMTQTDWTNFYLSLPVVIGRK